MGGHRHGSEAEALRPAAVWTGESPLTPPFPFYLQVEVTEPSPEVMARTGDDAHRKHFTRLTQRVWEMLSTVTGATALDPAGELSSRQA